MNIEGDPMGKQNAPQQCGRRGLVLWAAVVLGLSVAALLPHQRGSERFDDRWVAYAEAAETPAPATPDRPGKAAAATKPETSAKNGKDTSASTPPRASATTDKVDEPDAGATTGDIAKSGAAGPDIRISPHRIVIGPGSHGGRVHVQGLGADREFDSFDQFVEQAPWLAAMVFGVVFAMFLVPLLIIILVIWYKMRRARMLNETMLKLAEKGVAPSPEAMETLAGNPSRPATAFAAAPLYQQARLLQHRAAASDLRKGVIMIAVGLAFVFYSMINDASANWIGLVLLFLGVGYCVLWVLEDRSAAQTVRSYEDPGTTQSGRAGPPAAGGT
jgi:hypothetical protein